MHGVCLLLNSVSAVEINISFIFNLFFALWRLQYFVFLFYLALSKELSEQEQSRDDELMHTEIDYSK